MKIEVDIGILILFLFSYILMAVILLEIYYFELKLRDLVGLVNHLIGVI